MLTKKWCVILAVGLFMLIDWISTIVLNLLTGGEYYDWMMDHSVVGFIICVIGYPLCYRYLKNNFGKQEVSKTE